MKLIRLCLLVLSWSIVSSAADAKSCDDTLENGGSIFLRAAMISYSPDHSMLNVIISANDYAHINSFNPACNLTINIHFPSMQLKLIPSLSNSLLGFEPRYARFVRLMRRQ